MADGKIVVQAEVDAKKHSGSLINLQRELTSWKLT